MSETLTRTAAAAPIVFAGNPLDRAANFRKDTAWIAERMNDPASRFLPLWQLKGLIRLAPVPAPDWRPLAEVADWVGQGATIVFLGMAQNIAHFAVGIDNAPGLSPASAAAAAVADEPPLRPGWGKFIDVRSIAPQLAPGDAGVLAQARSLVDWHARHRFCAACGQPTAAAEAGYVRRCADAGCGAHHFPRTDPVVIMLVLRGDMVLLGRQPMFPAGMYSALAGFIEPGETLEEAVRREVQEEAAIAVGAVRYHASQPWPFPSSLMIGCMAEATSERIEVDTQELEDARWFTKAEVARMLDRSLTTEAPRMPPPLSLAHQLAKAWVG